MKKRLFALCASLFIAVMSITASASEEFYRLQDTAGLLSEAENAQIQALLDEVSEKHGMDITILTVDAVEEGLTVEQDADEWYEYLEFDTDGVMLYVSMEKGDWYLLTSGYGITAITDAGIKYISNKFVGALSDGNYAGAFNAYVKHVDEFIVQAKTGEPYDVGNMPKEPYSPVFSFAGIISTVCLGICSLLWLL